MSFLSKITQMTAKLSLPFLFVLVLLFMQTLLAQTLDRIVAVVNNEVITQSDVNRVLATIEAEYRTVYLDSQELEQKLEEAEKNIINQMVEEKLILSEAKKNGIEVEQDLIEARIKKIMESFPNEVEFERALVENELTLKDLRTRFNEQEMMKKAVDYFVRSRIKVDPQQLSQFYAAHQEDFFQPEKAIVKSIFIKVDESSGDDQSLQRAKNIHQRLVQGEAFEDLAKEFSQGAMASEGGNLGVMEKGQLLKEIDEATFKLNPGEFTDVLKTPTGYHIFKVEEKEPKRILSFAEAQDIIKNKLYQKKFTEAFKEWIDGLKRNAYIEIK